MSTGTVELLEQLLKAKTTMPRIDCCMYPWNYEEEEGEGALEDLWAWVKWAKDEGKGDLETMATVMHDLAQAGEPGFSPRTMGWRQRMADKAMEAGK